MSAVRLLVTRPPDQAQDWVQRLQTRGVDAVALPLIHIAPPADLALLRQAWHTLAQQRLVMFVSANAVSGFFAARPTGAPWPAQTLAGATGPGTSAALRAQGVPTACVVEPPRQAAQFDSEALWRQLKRHDWAGQSALVVRGEDGRDWLAEQLTGRGARVHFVAAYRRTVPVLAPTEQTLLADARAQPRAWLWLLSSSQAVDHLRQLAPASDWSAAQAIATHARIEQAARAAGFGQVRSCAPTVDAVAAVVAEMARSLQSPPPPAQRR